MPPGLTMLPRHIPRDPSRDEAPYEVAVWLTPPYRSDNALDGAWSPVAWTPSRQDADIVAEAFLGHGHQIVQIWHHNTLVGERSNWTGELRRDR